MSVQCSPGQALQGIGIYGRSSSGNRVTTGMCSDFTKQASGYESEKDLYASRFQTPQITTTGWNKITANERGYELQNAVSGTTVQVEPQDWDLEGNEFEASCPDDELITGFTHTGGIIQGVTCGPATAANISRQDVKFLNEVSSIDIMLKKLVKRNSMRKEGDPPIKIGESKQMLNSLSLRISGDKAKEIFQTLRASIEESEKKLEGEGAQIGDDNMWMYVLLFILLIIIAVVVFIMRGRSAPEVTPRSDV